MDGKEGAKVACVLEGSDEGDEAQDGGRSSFWRVRFDEEGVTEEDELPQGPEVWEESVKGVVEGDVSDRAHEELRGSDCVALCANQLGTSAWREGGEEGVP